MVGRGSGMRVAAGPDGVGVGVVVWKWSVAVGVGLATRFCVGSADADLAGRLSVIISIGVAVVSGLRVEVGSSSSDRKDLVWGRCGE